MRYRNTVSICVMVNKTERLQLHNIIKSFEQNGMEICDQNRLESLEEKKGGANFMQVWYQQNLKTLYQRTIGRQTYKDPAPKTLDELQEDSDYASPGKM